MNIFFLGHVGVFLLAALACFLSIPRARTIQHQGTREGFVAILVTCGVWATGYVGYFLIPGRTLKVALYILGLISALACVGAWLYFSAAYTGRSPRHAPYRGVAVGAFLVLVGVKITNPLHQRYFTTEWVTEPFAHLAIRHGLLHWVVLGGSYVVVGISFFLLLERFHHAGTDTKPLVALVGVTALPIAVNILSVTTPSLLVVWYEPIGVAIFAVGTLFVYLQRFEAIQLAGESDAPAIFLDRDTCIRDYNQAASTLFPDLDGSIGRPIDTVLPVVTNQVDAETTDEDLITVDHADEERVYQVSSSPFMMGEVVTGRLVSFIDVTEREQYRDELEIKTEQLETLNRVIRHDIRNDMAVILGWAETLPEHVDQAGKDAVDRILRKSKHVIELTEIARDFVDSLTDPDDLELHPREIHENLELEVEAARESYPTAQFQIVGEIPPVSVQANEMLSSVFRNLLNNAVQHNDKDTPEVTVMVADQSDSVEIRIADNGPGVPDGQKERIFGKGEKGLGSSGTGIGLYLVKTLVEGYGGDVWVEDNDPTGAVFVVKLSKAADDP